MFKNILIFTVILILVSACNKEDKIAEQSATDKSLIEGYVAENNLIGAYNASNLWYDIEIQGGGVQAYTGATVTVVYTGYLLNGNQFDEGPAGGATFSLNNVIAGWQQGIPKFKEGGKGKLIIPSVLGYGTQVVGDIPENSVLIFDIELVDVL
jgi:FKBP-type peptidyl-prolyl cis-trans isomerase FkpA